MRLRHSSDDDLLVTLSRRMVLVGMFFVPLLRIRVAAGLSVSDAIFGSPSTARTSSS